MKIAIDAAISTKQVPVNAAKLDVTGARTCQLAKVCMKNHGKGVNTFEVESETDHSQVF